MALAAAAGAWLARPMPWSLAAVLFLMVLALRRPVLLCLLVAVVASILGARAEAGMKPPTPGRYSGVVTLAGDPREVLGGAVSVEAKVGDRRVEMQARGRNAARLRPRLAGERVTVAGEIGPVPAAARAYLSRRHVSARLTVKDVGGWAPGNAPSRLANGLRRTLVEGAGSMAPERRALYAGFVLGDDRGQPPEVVDDFRSSGLSHLLVVSGQNVAFVLALAAPLLRRLRLGWRLAAGLLLLAIFGVLTRWEPSVLRAEAMAALALVSATSARPASGLRILALAVTGLLLVDPFLVGSVGFLLSVGASAGILVLAKPIAGLIPGPRPLAQAVGLTVAAQVGVAPILVPVFGGIPVASLPANLLAVPLAAPVMMWGLAAGLPAGLLGGTFATVAHVPTTLLVGWIAGVARWGAALPLGQIETVHAMTLCVIALFMLIARVRGHGWATRCAALAAAVVLLAPAVATRRPAPLENREITAGAALWRRGSATVLVVGPSSPGAGRLLEGLRSAGVGRLSLVVLSPAGVNGARSLEPILRRIPARLVLAPEKSAFSSASTPNVGDRIGVGDLVVEITGVEPRLTVRVGEAQPARRAANSDEEAPPAAAGRSAWPRH